MNRGHFIQVHSGIFVARAGSPEGRFFSGSIISVPVDGHRVLSGGSARRVITEAIIETYIIDLKAIEGVDIADLHDWIPAAVSIPREIIHHEQMEITMETDEELTCPVCGRTDFLTRTDDLGDEGYFYRCSPDAGCGATFRLHPTGTILDIF